MSSRLSRSATSSSNGPVRLQALDGGRPARRDRQELRAGLARARRPGGQGRAARRRAHPLPRARGAAADDARLRRARRARAEGPGAHGGRARSSRGAAEARSGHARARGSERLVAESSASRECSAARRSRRSSRRHRQRQGSLSHSQISCPGEGRRANPCDAVTPGADRTELVGWHGDAWKVRVASAPSADARTTRYSDSSPRRSRCRGAA